MKRVLHGAALATILAGHVPAGAQTSYTCGQGTVRGVQAVSRAIVRETLTARRNDDGDGEASVEASQEQQHRIYVLAVQLGDRLYTSESAGDPYGTLDPMRLVPGDAIDMCANTQQMIVERPDGTDYRAPVVRVRITTIDGETAKTAEVLDRH